MHAKQKNNSSNSKLGQIKIQVMQGITLEQLLVEVLELP